MKQLFIEWKVPVEWNGRELKQFLREEKHISRRALADIKYGGGKIVVNNSEVTVRHFIKQGDLVSITFPQEDVSEWIRPYPMELDIVFEDNHLLVINKPPHLPTVPSLHNEESLGGAVIHYYMMKGIPSTFHAVNRLDKDTSGLMIVAKHRYAHDLFVQLQRNRGIKRKYQALVHGSLNEAIGIINQPIGRKEDSIIEREVRADGQVAVTHFRVLELYSNTSLLELNLETGRTHQIRVHMSHHGHPLIGDTLYGGKRIGINRQGLHASELEFYHPIEQREYCFTSPLPDDMKHCINHFSVKK